MQQQPFRRSPNSQTTNWQSLILQLTFGGAPCPFEWNIISESIRDLVNAILYSNNWDPHSDYAPCQHLVPPINLMGDSISFAEGAERIVNIPVDPRGTGDAYIDDLLQAAVIIDGTNNTIRCKCATLLAIDACVRSKHPNEPIPREEMEAHNKLEAEAGLEECKTILGWLVDTRCLLLSLPNNKFVAWTAIIEEVLERGTTLAKEMESIIGRLGHLGIAIHAIYHFMSRLCDLQDQAKSRRSITINEECCNDLRFMIGVIKRAHDGIDLNIIIY
jgi:hypothetical protein